MIDRSKCCNAEVQAEGMPDFLGSKEACTFHFSCLRCGKPCDVVEREPAATTSKECQKLSIATKRIKKF